MRASRDERGASALELAVLAPALLFLIFFSIQAALYFYGRNVALQSAREAVAQLRLSPDEADYNRVKPGVVEDIKQYGSNLGRECLIEPKVTSTYDDDDSGKVTATVTGQVITLVPGLDLSVTQTAEGPIESFEYGDRPTEDE